MASYAEMASRGPHQSAEEFPRAAPPVPELQHTDETHSTVDVDNPHISSVPSDYRSQEIQTDSQRTRHEREESDRQLKEEAQRQARVTKEKAKRAADLTKKNADNPVMIGNIVVVSAIAAVLGYGAYQRVQRGPVSWSVLGGWAAIVGAVGVADVFVSRWLLQKYPPKQ